MVLQQRRPVPVGGWARPGEKITVTLRGTTRGAITDSNGRWRVVLPVMTAGGPFNLTVSGTRTIVLKDVLVGEVWVMSGQSNMNFQRAGKLLPFSLEFDDFELVKRGSDQAASRVFSNFDDGTSVTRSADTGSTIGNSRIIRALHLKAPVAVAMAALRTFQASWLQVKLRSFKLRSVQMARPLI